MKYRTNNYFNRNGKTYVPGDVIEMSPDEAAAFPLKLDLLPESEQVPEVLVREYLAGASFNFFGKHYDAGDLVEIPEDKMIYVSADMGLKTLDGVALLAAPEAEKVEEPAPPPEKPATAPTEPKKPAKKTAKKPAKKVAKKKA